MLKYFFSKTMTDMSEKSPYNVLVKYQERLGQSRSPTDTMSPNKLLLAKLEN